MRMLVIALASRTTSMLQRLQLNSLVLIVGIVRRSSSLMLKYDGVGTWGFATSLASGIPNATQSLLVLHF
jgi:hypothetical protein